MAEESKVMMKIDMELEPIKEMCKKLEEAIKHEFSKGIENIDTMEMKEAVDMLKDLYEAKEKIAKTCYYKSVIEAMEEHDFEDEEEIMDEGRRGYRGQPRSQSGRFMSRGDGRRSNRGRGGRRGYEDEMYYTMTPEMYMAHDPEYYRDMDREQMGRMYYSGGSGSSGGSSSGSMGGQSSGGMSGGSSGGGQSSGGSSGGSGGSRGYSEGGSQGGRGQSSRSENARRGYEETKMMQDGSPESKKKAMESLENYMKELGEDMTELVGKMDANEKSMLKSKLQMLAQKVQ